MSANNKSSSSRILDLVRQKYRPIRPDHLSNGFAQRKRQADPQRTFHSHAKQFRPSTMAEDATLPSSSTSRFAEEEVVSVNIKEENDSLIFEGDETEEHFDANDFDADASHLRESDANHAMDGNPSDHDDDIGIISELVGVGEFAAINC